MSFWKMLSGKQANPEEIAGEIIKLKKDLPKYEQALKESENQSIRLRQMKIGGERVSSDDIAKATFACESARQDLCAVQRSIDDLKKRLSELCAEVQERKLKNIASEKVKLIEEQNKIKDKLYKLIVEARACQIEFNGENMDPAGVGHGINIVFAPEYYPQVNFPADVIRELKSRNVIRSVSTKLRILDQEINDLQKYYPDEIAKNMLRDLGSKEEEAILSAE